MELFRHVSEANQEAVQGPSLHVVTAFVREAASLRATSPQPEDPEVYFYAVQYRNEVCSAQQGTIDLPQSKQGQRSCYCLCFITLLPRPGAGDESGKEMNRGNGTLLACDGGDH